MWAGQVITKYHVGPSGLTAYEGMTGHRANHGVCGLGEYAHFAITLDTTSVDNEMPVYSRGICLGMIVSTTEYLMAAQGEIFKCRSVKKGDGGPAIPQGLFEGGEIQSTQMLNANAKLSSHANANAKCQPDTNAIQSTPRCQC